MRYKEKRDKLGHFIPVITNRIKICKFCGKEWTPSIKNWVRNKFCSPSCASKSHPSGRKGKVGGQYQKDMMKLKNSGSNHVRWIKDRTKAMELHRRRASVKMQQWRMKIFTRDKFTCQECGRKKVYLEAHHIKNWKNHPRLRSVVSNGITLCRECHIKTRWKEDQFVEKYTYIINNNVSHLVSRK